MVDDHLFSDKNLQAKKKASMQFQTLKYPCDIAFSGIVNNISSFAI